MQVVYDKKEVRDMEIRNLQTFLQVAVLQNITQASKELGYSQSNVSTQIQQLEKEVGAPLFNRMGRGVTLTQYGEELLPFARSIVSTSLQMENFLKSEAAMGGVVKVGIVESLFDLLTEDIFVHYHERFPRVKLELTVDATETLKEQLKRGLLDVACVIDHPLVKTEWQCWYHVDVPIEVVAHPTHPLAKKEKVAWSELEQQEFVLMEGSAPYSIQFQQLLAAQRITLQPFLKLQSTDMACRLVEQGRYLSILPFYAVRDAVEKGRVKILQMPGEKQMQSVQIVLHESKVMIPQIEGWMEELKTILEKTVKTEKKI